MSQIDVLKQQLSDAGGLLKVADARLTELEVSETAFTRHLHAEKIAQSMVDRSMIPVEKYASTVSELSSSDQDLTQMEAGLAFVNSTGRGFDIGETSDPKSIDTPVKEASVEGKAPRRVLEDRAGSAARIMDM